MYDRQYGQINFGFMLPSQVYVSKVRLINTFLSISAALTFIITYKKNNIHN